MDANSPAPSPPPYGVLANHFQLEFKDKEFYVYNVEIDPSPGHLWYSYFYHGLLLMNAYSVFAHTTDLGNTVSIDLSFPVFIQKSRGIEFVEAVIQRCIDPEGVAPDSGYEVANALKGVLAKMILEPSKQYILSGLTEEPTADLRFSEDTELIEYYNKTYGIVLKFPKLPSAFVEMENKTVYIPLEVTTLPKSLTILQFRIVGVGLKGRRPDHSCSWKYGKKKVYLEGSLKNWILLHICENFNVLKLNKVYGALRKSFLKLGMILERPEMGHVTCQKPVEQHLHETLTEKLKGGKYDLVFVIIPDESYHDEVKHLLDREVKVASQLCLWHNIEYYNSEVATSLAVKINAKVGGKNVVAAIPDYTNYIASVESYYSGEKFIKNLSKAFRYEILSPRTDTCYGLRSCIQHPAKPVVRHLWGGTSVGHYQAILRKEVKLIHEVIQRHLVSVVIDSSPSTRLKMSTFDFCVKLVDLRSTKLLACWLLEVMAVEVVGIVVLVMVMAPEMMVARVTELIKQRRISTRDGFEFLLLSEFGAGLLLGGDFYALTQNFGAILLLAIHPRLKTLPPWGVGLIFDDQFISLHAKRVVWGTCGAVYYNVIVDENNFSREEVYTMTYHLCFMYPGATHSISTVAPVRCAKRAARQVECYMKHNGLGVGVVYNLDNMCALHKMVDVGVVAEHGDGESFTNTTTFQLFNA
ncbi:hypothetical protein RJ640_003034 [Escallonia rubra]|uniref:PAZ domain-containing protein n=1 Tax=Escallonia rubra TaxID=112253 RepID=A0AA88RBY7_9ASTE|nr:hypothetical protein RJ640_003034 [Escallonia rubra]